MNRTSSTMINSPHLPIASNPDCSLLSESLSLDSISIASSSLETIPPFPVEYMLSTPKIITTSDHNYTPTRNTRRLLRAVTTATIPTPPRLKTMLQENLSVQRWTESITSNAEAPGHIPWSDVDSVSDMYSWVAEGSIHSCEAFQEALATSRNRNTLKIKTPLLLSSTSTTPSSVPTRSRSRTRRSLFNVTGTSNAAYRKALVFEREIMLRSEGKTKRWSLQVPANSMNPDMVDMMLELRDLNSFFKGNEEDEPQPEDATLPSLIISTSQSAIPLSLESTGSMEVSSSAPTLAERRGNTMLPPLTLSKRDVTDTLPYPSIPTAFRGSPSSYSPKFEFAGKCESKSPMGLQEMVDSLRMQCAFLQEKPSAAPAVLEEEEEEQVISDESLAIIIPPPADPATTYTSELEGNDEWAFARGFLHQDGDASASASLLPYSNCNSTKDRDLKLSIVTRTDVDSEVVVPEQDFLDTQAILASTNPNTVAETLSTRGTMANSSPTPTPTPTPSVTGSSPTLRASPTLPTRGILKRCKSVRFAEALVEPPQEQVASDSQSAPSPSNDNDSEVKPPPPPPVRRSLEPSSKCHPHPTRPGPSPLRHTYTPPRRTSNTETNLTVATSSLKALAAGRQKASDKASRSTPSFTASSPATHVPASTTPAKPNSQKQKPKPKFDFKKSRPDSQKLGKADSQKPRLGHGQETVKTPARSLQPIPIPSASSVERTAKCRSSLNPTPTPGKENNLKAGREKLLLTSSAAKKFRHRTLDENALRRGDTVTGGQGGNGNGGTSGPGPTVQKSRMPVPLRNIFTKFK